MGTNKRPSELHQLYDEHALLSKELEILYRRLSFRGRGIRTASAEQANESDAYGDPYDFSSIDSDGNPNGAIQLYTKLPPWFEKSKLIRDELELAGQYKEQLETAQCEIQARQNEIMRHQGNEKETKREIEIMKLQLAKERSKRQDLLEVEKRNVQSDDKIAKLENENRRIKREIQQLESEKTSLQRECERQKKTLFEYKTQGANAGSQGHNRVAMTVGHSPSKLRRNPGSITSLSTARLTFTPEMDYIGARRSREESLQSLQMSPSSSNILETTSQALIGNMTAVYNSPTRSAQLLRNQHQRSVSFINSSPVKPSMSPESRTGAGRGRREGSSDRERDQSASLEYQQQKNYLLKHQLKESKLEVVLLKKTIGSLRKKMAQLQMHQDWETIKYEIKPLPSFSIIDEGNVQEFESRKRFYALRRQLFNGKLPNVKKLGLSDDGNQSGGSTSSTDASTDDDFDDEEEEEEQDDDKKVEIKNDSDDVSITTVKNKGKKNKKRSLKKSSKRTLESMKSKRKLHQEQHTQTAQELRKLRTEFDSVWASPTIVDVGRKATGTQTYIARNYALRNINEKLLKIQKNCLETKVCGFVFVLWVV